MTRIAGCDDCPARGRHGTHDRTFESDLEPCAGLHSLRRQSMGECKLFVYFFQCDFTRPRVNPRVRLGSNPCRSELLSGMRPMAGSY
jgi:hypothetical protein